MKLNLAASTVSTGRLRQKCQGRPQFGDLGQMDFLKQLFLLAEALKTQPGLRSWATTGPRLPGLGIGSQGPCP